MRGDPPVDPPAELHDEELEARLRATLHRRAADVRPHRPGWDTLAATGAPGARGPSGTATGRGGRRGGGGPAPPGWVRPVAAAASVLAVVLVATVVLDRSGTGDGDAGEEAQATGLAEPSRGSEDLPLPVPGSERFDLLAATPTYPVTDEELLGGLPVGDLDRLTDPQDLASEYLAAVGIHEEPGRIDEVQVDLAERGARGDLAPPDWSAMDEVAMAWSTWRDGMPALASGHVYLRRAELFALDQEVPDRVWMIVGARTQGIALEEVRREGTTLSFVVDRGKDGSGMQRIQVEVNGRMIQDGRVAVEGPQRFVVQVPGDEIAVIQVQHLDRQQPASITSMAVPGAV